MSVRKNIIFISIFLGGTINSPKYITLKSFDLSSLKNIEISLKDNNTYISFKENIDQYQDLDVEIQLTQDQDRYKIIKWQEVTSKEWKNESTLPLLGSE